MNDLLTGDPPARSKELKRPAWENRVHRFFVSLATFDRLPLLLVIAWQIMDGVLLGWWADRLLHTPLSFWMVALVFLAFVSLDAAALALLPRLGLSFGPLNSVWGLLGLARWATGALSLTLLAAFNVAGTGPYWAVFALPQVMITAALLWSCYAEPFSLQITRLELALPGIPAGKSTRVVHLSDIHLERLTRREEAVLQIISQADPDYIFLTGDNLNLSYIHDPDAMRQFNAWAGRLRARLGIYAVPGGPPVDSLDLARQLFRGSPVRLLENEMVTVNHEGFDLQVVGITCQRDKDADGVVFAHVIQSARDSRPTIFLYHSPDLMPAVAASGRVDLYLAGHTHGGQICLPIYGAMFTCSDFGKRYEAGLYRQGRTSLYVSRGIGLEGLSAPRARFLSRPEVVILTLTGQNTPASEC